MMGIEDGWVVAAYVLCLASAALCIVYGALHWNKGDEPLKQEDLDWEREEREEIEEAFE